MPARPARAWGFVAGRRERPAQPRRSERARATALGEEGHLGRVERLDGRLRSHPDRQACFYHTHNRAVANLCAGQYSDQVGPVYIGPKLNPGPYAGRSF